MVRNEQMLDETYYSMWAKLGNSLGLMCIFQKLTKEGLTEKLKIYDKDKVVVTKTSTTIKRLDSMDDEQNYIDAEYAIFEKLDDAAAEQDWDTYGELVLELSELEGTLRLAK